MASRVLLGAPLVSLKQGLKRGPDRQHGRLPEAVILIAAILGLLVWLASGAFRWQGYPVDHAWGRPVTAVLGLASLAVFAAIGSLAVNPAPRGLRTVITALVGWTVSRLTLTSLFPLISDEAYHWMWAKHLDLGYYDHPGMVAWMGRLFAPFHGQAATLARLSAVGQSAGIVLLVYVLARAVTRSSAIAARSALVLMFIPIYALGFMLLVPSVAVNLFWLVALIFAWRASERNRMVDWVIAGLACGAAADANFTTFLLPVCIFAYLLIIPQTRRLLLRPGPYVAILTALIAFAPTLIWNAHHQWATILWNLYRRYDPTRFRLDGLSVYLGELLGFLSPLLAAVMVWAAAKAARAGWRQRDRAIIFLSVMGLGPLLAWLGVSCIKFIVAYYAAPAFALLLILYTRQHVNDTEDRAGQSAQRWYKWACCLACAQTMVMVAGMLAPVFVPAEIAGNYLQAALPETGSMWMGDIYGWSALGRYLDSLGVKMNAHSRIVAIGPTYAQSSLAMYLAKNVEMAYALDAGTGRYGQQFVFWAPLTGMPLGCDAVFFRPGKMANPMSLRKLLLRHFDRVEEQDAGADPRLQYFTIIRAYDYKGGLGIPATAGSKTDRSGSGRQAQ